MRCPHCDEEILGPVCPQCDVMTPEGANFCMGCGVALEEQVETTNDNNDENDNDFDFDNRVLCPDGNCTGIIVDGKCVECGIIYKGD